MFCLIEMQSGRSLTRILRPSDIAIAPYLLVLGEQTFELDRVGDVSKSEDRRANTGATDIDHRLNRTGAIDTHGQLVQIVDGESSVNMNDADNSTGSGRQLTCQDKVGLIDFGALRHTGCDELVFVSEGDSRWIFADIQSTCLLRGEGDNRRTV